MYVHHNTPPIATPLPGIAHTTLAGSAHGLQQVAIWQQELAAGAVTPVHKHPCEEVVVCECGEGELHIAGGVHRFAAGDTVVLPAEIPHQLINSGDAPLRLLAVFASAPVLTRLADETVIELPWQS